MNDIMKIVQALGDSSILLKGVTRTIKNKIKKEGFSGILLGNLRARKHVSRKGNCKSWLWK